MFKKERKTVNIEPQCRGRLGSLSSLKQTWRWGKDATVRSKWMRTAAESSLVPKDPLCGTHQYPTTSREHKPPGFAHQIFVNKAYRFQLYHWNLRPCLCLNLVFKCMPWVVCCPIRIMRTRANGGDVTKSEGMTKLFMTKYVSLRITNACSSLHTEVLFNKLSLDRAPWIELLGSAVKP